MVGLRRETVVLEQENGEDISLVVSGTELYATYQTLDGYPVVYDEPAGLFCYARVIEGEFVSTGVPVGEQVPADVGKGSVESDRVRMRKIEQRQREMGQTKRS
jgi:hypothetical protein